MDKSGQLKLRVRYLDGVRGWASLIVVLGHVFWELFGVRFPEFRARPLVILFDGPLAVYVFFILSGDALSTPAWGANGQQALAELVAKRYFRLTIPIFLSCFLVFALLKVGWVYAHKASDALGREDWLGQFLCFEPSLPGVIRYSLLEVYTKHGIENTYNPFLWTMSVEMVGSLLILLMTTCWAYFKSPRTVCLFVGGYLFLLGSPLAMFFFGCVLSSFRQSGVLMNISRNKFANVSSWVCIFLSIVGVTVLRSSGFIVERYTNMIFSLLIVGAIAVNVPLQRLFCSSLSIYLGRISFPMYLVQFPVLISFSSWSVVCLVNADRLDFAWALLIGVVSVVVVILVASLFELVERFILARANKLVLRFVASPASGS